MSATPFYRFAISGSAQKVAENLRQQALAITGLAEPSSRALALAGLRTVMEDLVRKCDAKSAFQARVELTRTDGGELKLMAELTSTPSATPPGFESLRAFELAMAKMSSDVASGAMSQDDALAWFDAAIERLGGTKPW